MRGLFLATLVATAAAATRHWEAPPRSAILQLGAQLASAELQNIQWSSPLARGVMVLLSTLLSPILRRAVALTPSPLALAGHLNSGSFRGQGNWSSSNLTIHGLETLGPLSVLPDDDTHLNATASFGRLQTAMTLDAQAFGMAAKLRAEASVANVTIRLRWACAPLRRAAEQAARGGAELAEALKLRIDAVEVSIEGPLELQAHESERSIGAPAVLWRWFNTVFARELRRTVEAQVAEAVYETLASMSSDTGGPTAAPGSSKTDEACSDEAALEGG